MPQLSLEQTYDLANRYFGDLGPQAVETVVRLANEESGRLYGESRAIGDNFASGHQSADSPARYDYGPLQVNSQHGFDAQRLVDDPAYNFAAARQIYDAQGFDAWTTYPAVVQQMGGGGAMPDGQEQSVVGFYDGLLEAWQASEPTRDDYTSVGLDGQPFFDAAEYNRARREWVSEGTSLYEARERAATTESGIVALPDGTVITDALIAQAERENPALAAQYRAIQQQQLDELEREYNETLNRYGLEEFGLQRSSALDERDRQTQDYLNRSTRYGQQVGQEEMSQDRAARLIDRQLRGMQEARARAEFETDTLQAAAPYAVAPGTTALTGRDLGPMATNAARMAGIRGAESAPLLPMQGTVNIDPRGALAAYGQQLGVAGPVPLLPELSLPTPPATPALVPGPAAPSLIPPQRPALIAPAPGGAPLVPGQPGPNWYRGPGGGTG